MLTKRIRKQIEWHFYNYQADAALYSERLDEIVWAGIGTSFDRVGGRSSGAGDEAAFHKALQIERLDREMGWATVVRNTFNAFRFEPEYRVMEALYIHHKSKSEILCNGLWQSTFYRWRDKWLEYAYKWAREYKLL